MAAKQFVYTVLDRNGKEVTGKAEAESESEPEAEPEPEADSSEVVPASKIPGKHKSPEDALADAKMIVDSVHAYMKEHNATREAGREALYRQLGHNSAAALKTAYYRARKLLEGN